MGALTIAARMEPGIFLMNYHSNAPFGFYHPLFKYLNEYILLAISVEPITIEYYNLLFIPLLNDDIFIVSFKKVPACFMFSGVS